MCSAIINEIGGEEGVRRLVDRFYDLIETHPDGAGILKLHQNGHGIAHARVEQFNFLCGFFGGRNHYLEKHRHMNVREMHAHVPIRQKDAENWLKCMNQALDDCALEGEAVDRIKATFRRVAMMLVNDLPQTD